MKIKRRLKSQVIIELLLSLCILLFVYAAVSKLLDFETFKAQIGQSPVLSSFSEILAWTVPISELVVAVMLIHPKFRLIGLMSFYSLMLMFTTYIFIILNFSDFVPCSCGGVLEKLGWTEHLIFNGVFIVLATVGIIFTTKEKSSKFAKL